MKSENTVCGPRLSLWLLQNHSWSWQCSSISYSQMLPSGPPAVETISLSVKSFKSNWWLLPRVIVSLKIVLWLYSICNILSVFFEQNYLNRNFDTWYTLSISNGISQQIMEGKKTIPPEHILYIKYIEWAIYLLNININDLWKNMIMFLQVEKPSLNGANSWLITKSLILNIV